VSFSLVEGSLLVCTCSVSGWHKLWAFTHFLDDEDDTTPDFRDFYISHEKKLRTVDKASSTKMFIIYFVCIKIPLHEDPKSKKPLVPQVFWIRGPVLYSGTFLCKVCLTSIELRSMFGNPFQILMALPPTLNYSIFFKFTYVQ
jgi:hypothetical protein